MLRNLVRWNIHYQMRSENGREWWVHTDLNSGCQDLFQDNISTFIYKNWRNPWRTSASKYMLNHSLFCVIVMLWRHLRTSNSTKKASEITQLPIFLPLFQSITKVQQNVSLTNIFLTIISLLHCKSYPGYTQHKHKKCTMELPFIVYSPPYSVSSFTDPTKLAVLGFSLGQCLNALHLRKKALVPIWWKSGWASELVWTLCRREIHLDPPGNWTINWDKKCQYESLINWRKVKSEERIMVSNSY